MKLILKSFVVFLIAYNFQNMVEAQLLNQPEKEEFMFLINSDPQMGDEHTDRKNLKILNELLEQFVEETNSRQNDNKPDFVVWGGDLVWDPFQNAFDNFQRIVKKMTVPSVLVHGNHDGYEDDPKFLNLQQNLSGYKKLNYSFDYGKWRFIVIAAQEKYFSDEKKKDMLKWLDGELKSNKDKQIMLFMHYHILPVGLSQMEFYSYFPMNFKNQLLDTITRYNNVKHVFSGHVHIGIKASIKTARNYKGTNFILAPTPVFPRPFGEEFVEFSEKGSRYDKRGFYLEVHVNNNDVRLVGRKINNKFQVEYPKEFQPFSQSEDPRAFKPEGQLKVNDQLINGDFDDGLTGWSSSLRYQTDKKPVFKNLVKNGQSMLRFLASYGAWTFDEYMENYQLIKYQDNMHLNVDFKTLPNKFPGGGGYFRVFAYTKDGELLKILLFHWGTQEQKVRFMQQSWAYNATGDRYGALWLDKKIAAGDMLSYKLNINPLVRQNLDIELSQLFNTLINSENKQAIDRLAIAYGVWGRISQKGRKFSSKLNVESITVSNPENSNFPARVMLNNQAIEQAETELDYGYSYKKDTRVIPGGISK